MYQIKKLHTYNRITITVAMKNAALRHDGALIKIK